MLARALASTFKGSREVNCTGQKSFRIWGWRLFTPSGPWGSKLHNMSFFNWRGTSWLEGRVEWSADWNGQRIENKLKREIVPCCPHVQPAAALPPHHSTSLQGWSAGGGARQSWWTHCHPALHHSGKDLKETITLSKCLRPSMKSSLVSVDRREHIALNKQIGFGLEYMNKYNLWNVPLPA